MTRNQIRFVLAGTALAVGMSVLASHIILTLIGGTP